MANEKWKQREKYSRNDIEMAWHMIEMAAWQAWRGGKAISH